MRLRQALWMAAGLGFAGIQGVQEAQAFDLAVLGGVSGTFIVTNPAITAAASPRPIADLALGFDWFELDLMYAPRAYTFSGVTETEQRFTLITYARIPVSIIDFLVGSYASFGIGNVTLSTGASATYAAAGQNPVDYGLAIGMGVAIPVSEKLRVLARFQGLIGLGNGFTVPLITLNYRDVQGLVGLRYSF